MAECRDCDANEASADTALPGPLGLKYDDREDAIDVVLVVPGVKRPSFWMRLFGKANTTVQLGIKEQSLRVYIEIEKGRKKRVEKCLYVSKKLPEKVLPSHSDYSIKDNQVVVTLRKAIPGSWQNVLDTYGLDISDQD